VKDNVLNCVTALHTQQPANTEPAYPHLRTLLGFDTREFFNVLSLAFDDAADMTPDKKQRIVDILLLLMVDGVGFSPAQVDRSGRPIGVDLGGAITPYKNSAAGISF